MTIRKNVCFEEGDIQKGAALQLNDNRPSFSNMLSALINDAFERTFPDEAAQSAALKQARQAKKKL